MRILEFQPGVYRNLATGPITFTVDPVAPLRAGCSIRFLVGPNGVGKTNILRFLTGIFLALDEDFRRPTGHNPAYSVPFRLVYQLRQNTIRVESTGRGRSGVQFTVNEVEREPGDFPSRDQILPATLLVYTSGDVFEWRTLFTSTEADEEDQAEIALDQLRPEEEMPPDPMLWAPVAPHQADPTNASPEADAPSEETAQLANRRIYLIEPSHLKIALLAALLHFQADQALDRSVNVAFRTTLDEIRVRLLAFSLLVATNDVEQKVASSQQLSTLSRLYDLATLPLQEWHRQRWVFDLAHIPLTTGQSTLLSLQDRLTSEPFQFFQTLVELDKIGILGQIELVLRYTSPKQEEAAVRVLLSDSLSDGEFSFLARMAIIYLLREEECLFLLDEPEVHFNDDWKRNLVDNIEQALTDTKSEVILTSHASITLTDAFPDEVILMGLHGQQQAPLTLGAEPGEILRRLFHAERTVGRRAMRRIEEIMKHGSDEALTALLDEVGAGFYRFKIVEELERRVSSA